MKHQNETRKCQGLSLSLVVGLLVNMLVIVGDNITSMSVIRQTKHVQVGW